MSTADPAFAPLDGVDLETDAKAIAAIAKSGVSTKADAARVAEGVGIPGGIWPAVSDGWVARTRESMVVRAAFGPLSMKY